MPTQYEDADVKCPFFRRQTTVSITCEGLTEDSVIRLCFTSGKAKDLQARIFCEKRYKNCEIYTMLEKKYEE